MVVVRLVYPEQDQQLNVCCIQACSASSIHPPAWSRFGSVRFGSVQLVGLSAEHRLLAANVSCSAIRWLCLRVPHQSHEPHGNSDNNNHDGKQSTNKCIKILSSKKGCCCEPQHGHSRRKNTEEENHHTEAPKKTQRDTTHEAHCG